MENTHQHKLNFAQRNWLLLCVLVALCTAVLVYYIQRDGNSSLKQGSEIENSTSSTIPGNDSAGIPPDSLSH